MLEQFRRRRGEGLLNSIGWGLLYTLGFLIAFKELMEVVPPRILWVSTLMFPLSVVAGVVVAVFVYKGIDVWKPAIVVTAVLILAYLGSFLVSPPKYATLDDLKRQFAAAGLSEVQLQQVQSLLRSQGYITEKDLSGMDLSPHQTQQILHILHSAGFVTKEEVLQILATQQAQGVAGGGCFITPLPGYSSVSVRSGPSADNASSPPITYLMEGERARVLGHNRGRVNVDRWWFVEISRGGHVYRGWVASWVVQEVNISSCNNLP